jgi:hypothetical protein
MGSVADIDGVKVFSATKQKDRDELGETATRWLREKKNSIQLIEKTVTQSSDNEYHCLTIIFFYRHLNP